MFLMNQFNSFYLLNVSRLIQEVKNILDKKDVLHQANGNRIVNRVGASQAEFSTSGPPAGDRTYNEGTEGYARELPTNIQLTKLQLPHRDSQARLSGFGSSVNIHSRQEPLDLSNHLRIASAAGHRFDIQANPTVSFEHENSLRTANIGYWSKGPRKVASSGGIPFRFSGRLALMANFIEQYNRVKVSPPNPEGTILKNLNRLQVTKVNITLSASSKQTLQKLQASTTRIVDYSQSSARSLGKTSSRRTPKGRSTTTTPKQPQTTTPVPNFALPAGQGPKNLTKYSHILDVGTADIPSVRDLPVCEQPVYLPGSLSGKGQNAGRKEIAYIPQPVNSRPECVDGRPNTKCRKALVALALYSPVECAGSTPSQTSSSLPRVGKTFSLRPNRPVKPSTLKAPHAAAVEEDRALPDIDGWAVFRELTVERSVQLMQEFLLAEMKQRALVSESVQTEIPALMESVAVPETAQCNFVPVFPVEILQPIQSPRNKQEEDDERERTLTVYAERDWRLQSTNKEGLYEALRDQLERTSERMSLERAKESMKQAKAAQLRADQAQRQKLAKQQLLRDSGTSVDFISEHSEQYCRHLDCLTSGLSEEHYVHIADARQSRQDPHATTPTKPKLLVNLYKSRLLEENLSGAQMLSPSQDSHGSTYVRIGDILPNNNHHSGSQRVSASTKLAISTLSSSRDSRPSGNTRLARPEHRTAAPNDTAA